MRRTDTSDRESDYRMVRAVMALMAGGEGAPGDPRITVTVGPEIREIAQTRLLVEMLAARDKGGIYVEAVKPWARLRPPIVHVLMPTGVPEPRFDVTGRCSFWTADTAGPLLIVSPRGEQSFFGIVDERLVHHEGWPPGDIAAGIARASTRLRVAMHALKGVAEGLERMPSRTIRTADDIGTAFDT